MLTCDKLLRSSILLVASVAGSAAISRAQSRPSDDRGSNKRPITVADVIGMTRIAGQDYIAGGPTFAPIAHFSPDGKRFVIILRRGNLGKNTNEFTLLLFQTAEALPPEPTVLLTMSSSSNRDAITNIRWLADNETVVFLRENPAELPQVCTLNSRTKHIERITNHPTEIYSFDITPDGREIIYNALPPKRQVKDARSVGRNESEIVIAGQDLVDVLAGEYSPQGDEIFVQTHGQLPWQVSLPGGFVGGAPVSLSQDGRYALVGLFVRDVPSEWRKYGGFIHEVLDVNHPKGSILPFKQHLLVDMETKTSALLVNAPAAGPPIWSDDGVSVFLKTYLPLDVVDRVEDEA